MSSAKSQSKQKISDIAKDLGISNQELIDFVENKFGEVKKAAASLTADQLNIILENYTQNNQVESFDGYFAKRNEPKPVKKEEPKQEKKPAKKDAPKAEQPKQEAKKPVKKEAPKAEVKHEAVKTEHVKTEAPKQPKQEQPKPQPKQEAPKPAPKQEVKQEAKPAVHNSKNEQKNKADRFNAQQALKNNEQNKNKKSEQKPQQNKEQNQNKTKLDIKFADASSNTVDQKLHKVDTRGSYVEIDKYNEKYENIAPVQNGRHKDNFSKKQKLTQKSQQRKQQQYSNKHESEADKLRRLELERARKQQLKVLIPDEITVGELAARLKATATDVIKKLMGLGVMASINEVIDFDTAALVADEMGAKVEKEVIVTIEERLIDDSEDDAANTEERSPVVVVMGHVDHGKTSLLDKIRHANVTASEAGGITQHIGAYQVKAGDKTITFLDTPGHEAFTSMRARGADITDIAILVVAADDGIMPQTVESINHAKAANVSIVVAVNKMDKEGANVERVKQGLTEHGLVPEEWGGDVMCVPVSAKTGEGIDELLEDVLLIAEMKELKANPDRAAKGTVIEARLDKGRGPIATVLVQNGTLHKGDTIIAGTCVGRVRVMTNDKGERVTEAGPSVPVEITGLDEVPVGGDIFDAVSDERLARTLVDQRKAAKKEEIFNAQTKVTLDNLFDQMKLGEIKELQIIVKADVQGSAEAVKQSLEKLSNDEVRVNVIHSAVGAINESDVMLAEASNAIIVGFNVRPDAVAAENAERSGVDMRLYSIIYDCINEIESAMKGMLAPKTREVVLGMAECRNVIKIKSVGTIAGSYVKSGKIQRGASVRVIRDGIVIADDAIASLQRFKDAVKEVSEGYECGIGLERFNDLKEGDMFEVYTIEEYRD